MIESASVDFRQVRAQSAIAMTIGWASPRLRPPVGV